ncbi:MAG: putative quinol monooxygenase [Anaerolineae bacterium]
MTATFGMVGTLKAKAEDRPRLVAILTQASELMGEVDGCLLYVVSEDHDDETAVWVIELWRDQSAHEASLQLSAVRELIAQARPLLIGAPSGARLNPISGKGL